MLTWFYSSQANCRKLPENAEGLVQGSCLRLVNQRRVSQVGVVCEAMGDDDYDQFYKAWQVAVAAPWTFPPIN